MSTYLKVKDQVNLRITNKLDFTGSRKVDGSKQRPNHLVANVIVMTIDNALITMVVMTTSFWRRDMAILLETLRPIDGSGLVVKVIAGEGNTLTMMTIKIKPSGATEATEKKWQADNGKNLRS